jgi:glycosyltransferase involved in cell wall biosynthesis
VNILFPYLARWNSANWSRYHQLLNTLVEQGHQVVVLQPPARRNVTETNYIELNSGVEGRVTLVEVPMPEGFWESRWPFDKLIKKGSYSLALLSVVGRELRQRQSDVLLLYNLSLAPLLKVEGVFTVFDIADDLPAMLRHEAGWFGSGAAAVARGVQQWMIRRADCVTVASATLGQLVAPQAHVIANGANLNLIAQAQGATYRKRYGQPLVGFVGAFEYFVDFDLVLEAAARLPQTPFLLAGAGRCWDAVRQLVQQRGLTNVHLPGPLPYREALNAIAAMDVCLLPFAPGPVAETSSPLKLFEYAALGKPILSTPQAEIRRIGHNFVAFAASADEWVGILSELLNNEAARRRRGEIGARLIAEVYGWDRLAHNFVTAITRELPASSVTDADPVGSVGSKRSFL